MFDDESKLNLTNDVNLILNLRFSPIQQFLTQWNSFHL